MFEAGLFGTLEDLGYGARNTVSGLFTRSYNGGSGSDDNSDELSPEISVADIRKYYGDLMATVAEESIRTKVETLVAALSDEKSRLSKAIEYATKTTSAPEKIVEEVVMDVFTERLKDDEKIEFTKIFDELIAKDMTAADEDTEEPLDLTMGGKLKMSDKLVELISKISAGEVKNDDIVKQLENVDTNITFNIVDFIKDAITTAAKTEDHGDDDKTSPTASTKKAMDLKSLLMETEIGQKLFEHV